MEFDPRIAQLSNQRKQLRQMRQPLSIHCLLAWETKRHTRPRLRAARIVFT
jgi:hypothetical protein